MMMRLRSTTFKKTGMPHPRHNWSPEQLHSAVAAVREHGLSTYAAARQHNVPRSTVNDHVVGSPAHARQCIASASPAPRTSSPAASAASTSPASLRRLPKAQLVAALADAAARAAELQDQLEKERSLRMDAILRLPLSPTVSATSSQPAKRARTVPGFGVQTADALRAILTAKAAEKENMQAAKVAAHAARIAASPTGRVRGRPPAQPLAQRSENVPAV